MIEQSERFDGTSANITDEQKAKLKSLFPDVVTEGGKIDFDRLRLTLGESVDVGKERYGMNWPDKVTVYRSAANIRNNGCAVKRRWFSAGDKPARQIGRSSR